GCPPGRRRTSSTPRPGRPARRAAAGTRPRPGGAFSACSSREKRTPGSAHPSAGKPITLSQAIMVLRVMCYRQVLQVERDELGPHASLGGFHGPGRGGRAGVGVRRGRSGGGRGRSVRRGRRGRAGGGAGG